jgi:ferric-dicitrate binding protein FerR (iron transport regulator)
VAERLAALEREQAAPQPVRRRWRDFAAVAAGLLAVIMGGLLAAQIIIRITDKEGKVREVEVKPGEKIEIV